MCTVSDEAVPCCTCVLLRVAKDTNINPGAHGINANNLHMLMKQTVGRARKDVVH